MKYSAQDSKSKTVCCNWKRTSRALKWYVLVILDLRLTLGARVMANHVLRDGIETSKNWRNKVKYFCAYCSEPVSCSISLVLLLVSRSSRRKRREKWQGAGEKETWKINKKRRRGKEKKKVSYFTSRSLFLPFCKA